MQRERRPRTKSPKELFVPLLLVGGLLLMGFLLLSGGVVALMVIFHGGGNNLLGFNTAVSPKVNEANLKKLWEGMSLAEVQAILGDGKPCGTSEISRVCDASFDAYHKGMGLVVVAAGVPCRVQSWYRWQNGGLHAFAGFRKSKSGVVRLVLVRWFLQEPRGAFLSAEPLTVEDDPRLDPNALDLMAAEHDKRVNLLDNPKWKTGAAIRQALVGGWRGHSFDPVNFPSLAGYDFNADGSCLHINGPGDRHAGNYHFVDNSHIEVTTADELMVVGGGKRPWTRRYRVLVNDKELILVTENPSGPSLDETLERN